jgi:hypothetical protein
LHWLQEDLVGKPIDSEWMFAHMTRLIPNMLAVGDAIGPVEMRNCSLDGEQWYPLSRQLYAMGKLLANRKSYEQNAERLSRRLVPEAD